MSSRRNLSSVLSVALASALLFGVAACGATPAPTSTVAPTMVAATQAPTSAPSAATKVPSTATAVPPTTTPAPAVGGTLVLGGTDEPDSLDAQNTWSGASNTVLDLVGSPMLALNDKDGKFYGCLAESWTSSADGVTWTFKLKKGVKFHDGSAFTAKDYVWTFERGMDTSKRSGSYLAGMIESAEAPDDYTLVVRLKQPLYSFLIALCSPTYSQPLSKTAVEKWGDQYDRHPVSVGPYMFKEWQTGTKVVLERNPDYNWAPSFVHQGPRYIQTIEFRVVPESATVLAGLETGELDGLSTTELDVKDLSRIQATNKFQIFEGGWTGMNPVVYLNVSKAPFDDLKVRQAFNYAVDKATLIKVVALGNAEPQYGPLSAGQVGYWPGVEQIGYKFDLAKAKQLMKDAGYVAGADGMLSKDGKPLTLAMKTLSTAPYVNVAQVLQEQYKALGVDVKLEQEEKGVLVDNLTKANYDLCVLRVSSPDAYMLYALFHSSQVGGMNYTQAKFSELDPLLVAVGSTMEPVKRQEVVNSAVTFIVQNALCIPIYTPKTFYPVSNRVEGVTYSPLMGVEFTDAYIVTK